MILLHNQDPPFAKSRLPDQLLEKTAYYASRTQLAVNPKEEGFLSVKARFRVFLADKFLLLEQISFPRPTRWPEDLSAGTSTGVARVPVKVLQTRNGGIALRQHGMPRVEAAKFHELPILLIFGPGLQRTKS